MKHTRFQHWQSAMQYELPRQFCQQEEEELQLLNQNQPGKGNESAKE
jgi:hypothetical protein